MKNKYEKDFFESRDSWWSIKDLLEKYSDQNINQELNRIMELSLYNQRDMLIEIDNLKTEIHAQKRPKIQRKIEKPFEREVRFLGNTLLENIDKFLYKLKT